jgi:GAF domain-containing protein
VDLTAILRELIRDTAASRVTVRLDVAGMSFPVVAEVCDPGDPGVRPIAGLNDIDQRKAETVRHLMTTLKPLIQDDVATAEIAPPPALLSQYGARAQMLSPIVRNSSLLGYISVHQSGGPREWAGADREALRQATARVGRYFGADDSGG